MKLIVSAIFSLFFFTSVYSQPKTGANSPDIQLPDSKGVNISLSSLKGKVVLIDFWASWCGPCRRAVPAMREVYNHYKKKGFEIYAISLDADKNDWKRAIFEDNTKWLHVIDPEGKIATEWNVRFIPNTFLLDKEGKVVAINASEAELSNWLQKLLG